MPSQSDGGGSLQPLENGLGGVPLPRAVSAQCLPPRLELRALFFQRLIDGNGLLLALDPDAVDLPEYHILDPAARNLSGKDADTVSFCPALQP